MANQSANRDADNLTTVDYQHSPGFVPALDQLGLSLIVSTYQAGKVFVVSSYQGNVQIRFHQFEQPMGLARTPTGIAVGTRRQIWFLRAAPEMGPRIEPNGFYDGCFLARQSHYTGPILGHELAAGGNDLWVCNTLFSCLATLHPDFHFVPRWKPAFVSGLAPKDCCHLNGLALLDNQPKFVTCLGETDTPAGWRLNKNGGGCLIDVPSGEFVLRGLCMPHAPRVHQGSLYFLNSGHGRLERVDPASRKRDVVAQLPGYTRGLDCFGRYAFVGLSRIRETAVFGGLPVAERKDELRCGIAIVDLFSGKTAAVLSFGSSVEEIFEIKVMPGFRNPLLLGPTPDIDQGGHLWLAPPLGAF